jgi:pyruvate dehydrogenase E2 component (dihydrolipoyllysine-residue acetyltransferase)
MAEFVMPALGADMNAGMLLAWLKQPGESVARGEIIAVVHTDKADIEVESFVSGVVQELLVEPGTEVPTGTVLAVIGEPGEAPAAQPERAAPEAAPTSAPAVPAPEAAAVPARALVGDGGNGHRLLVSPSAKHLAADLGVDLSAVEGSGPGGRIQRKDVERAKAAAPPLAAPAPPAAAPAPAAPAAPAPAPAAAPTDDAQAAMRRAIAASMSRSKREVPHVYLSQTIDLSRAVAWLADENTRRSVPDRLLLGVLLVKAVAVALRDFPELNARWEGDQVVPSERIHVGNAIFLRGGGLVAPAIHDTDERTLDELMHSFRDLVARARSFSLRATEMSDPTITVTSIGERGVETIFPIIVPPQVAIVGFGKVVDRPWVSSGQLLVCPVVTATVSVDHRVADGHVGSAFLAAIDQRLQEPEEL